MAAPHRVRSSPLRSSCSAALLALVAADTASAQQLISTQVASGFAAPIGLKSPPGDVHRLFVLERAGKVRIVKDGVVLPAPFLDITAEVSVAGEGGLLGLAFHPRYATDGRFYVSFVQTGSADPVVREYHVGANPDVANASSGVDLFGPYPHQAPLHYGGDLHFGADGMLFYALGHGGPGFPQSLAYYDGKMLRFDVDAPAPHVPLDNPYASPSDGALDWIWASGLRNPFRFSFDRLTDDLYIADVGGAEREEIDFQPPSHGAPGSAGYQGGRNYGWTCMEGTLCTGSSECTCDSTGATLTLPVHELQHTGGSMAIIGGYVYRGSAIPGLQGRYFFSEYSSSKIWSCVVVNGQATQIVDHTTDLHAGLGSQLANIGSFGQDANGELYLTALVSGRVFRISPVAPPCPTPVAYCAISPNSAGSGAEIESTGSTSIVHDEFTLSVHHAPPNVAGAFFHGSTEASAPFGNGVRCAGGAIRRMPILHCDEHGSARCDLDYASAGVSAGTTRHFQLYFRDPAGGGALFNLSNGLRVVFCP